MPKYWRPHNFAVGDRVYVIHSLYEGYASIKSLEDGNHSRDYKLWVDDPSQNHANNDPDHLILYVEEKDITPAHGKGQLEPEPFVSEQEEESYREMLS